MLLNYIIRGNFAFVFRSSQDNRESNMTHIGAHYEPKKLSVAYEEQDFSTYRCSVCGYEAEVAVTFDLASGYFYPERIVDALCRNEDCLNFGTEMDRIK